MVSAIRSKFLPFTLNRASSGDDTRKRWSEGSNGFDRKKTVRRSAANLSLPIIHFCNMYRRLWIPTRAQAIQFAGVALILWSFTLTAMAQQIPIFGAATDVNAIRKARGIFQGDFNGDGVIDFATYNDQQLLEAIQLK